MKKRFMEPAMHRIELNLRENIAASTTKPSGTMQLNFLELDLNCCVQYTQVSAIELYTGQKTITTAEALACTIFVPTKSVGMTIPIEKLRPYIKG